MNQYNDYELLYLIYECEEDALGILFKKYDPLIKKKLHDFKVKSYCYEDYYQECLVILFLAIRKYSPFVGKSFTRYFELLLTRNIATMVRRSIRRKEEYIVDDLSMLIDEDNQFGYEDKMIVSGESKDTFFKNDKIDIPLNSLSSFEKETFRLRYVKGMSYQEIASITNQDVRKIYNSTYQARRKLRRILPINKMN